MASLLYIHGFLSSPLSAKAQQVKHWLQQQRPDIQFHCPQLPPYPDECAEILQQIIANAEAPVYLMGSSMGGFWSTWLAEGYNLPAVLINPAVNVLELMPKYLNQTLTNYHHDSQYHMTDHHLQQLAKYHIEQPLGLVNYWVLLQTGDETLDYRLAVEKYQGCRHTVEQGGDHSFQHFERFIPACIDFFEHFYHTQS